MPNFYKICSNTEKKFKAVKAHIFINGELNNVLCGKDFSKNFDYNENETTTEQIKNLSNLSEVVKYATCKNCIKAALKKIKNNQFLKPASLNHKQ